MTKAHSQPFAGAVPVGRPGPFPSINQDGLPGAFERAMRESRKINSDEIIHQVINGKQTGGMSGLARSTAKDGGVSRATGLLAVLLSHI